MIPESRTSGSAANQPAGWPVRLSRRMWLRRAGVLLLGTAGSGVLASCGSTAPAASSGATTQSAVARASVTATKTAAAGTTGTANAPTAVASTAAGTVSTTASRAATASAAPAAPNVQGGKPTIIYSCWGDPVQQQSDQACINAFEATNPNAGFTVKLEDAPWTDFHQHLQVQAAGGTDPDVMLISSAFFPNFARLGMFLDLTAYFTQAKLDWNNLPPGTQNFLSVGSKLYGMPVGGFGGGGADIGCAQPMFAAAGLPNPSVDWTWDDLVPMAQKLTSGGANDPNAHWGVDFAKTTWAGLWQTMLWTYGGDVWNKERTESIIDSPAAKTSFQYFKDLADRWSVSGADTDKKPFYAGKIGMIAEWAGDLTPYIDKAGFPVYTVLTPKGPQGHGIQPPTGQAHAYTIAATSKHPDDGWQYLQFLLTSPAAERARGLSSVARVAWKPNIPVFAAKLPANQKQWWSVQEYYIANMPAFAVLPPEITNRVLPTYDAQTKIINDQLTPFYAGQISVADTVTEMKRQLDGALKAAQVVAAK